MIKYKHNITQMALKNSDLLYKMPKIELHAHLFGSITQDQLLNLLKDRGCIEQYNEFKQIKDSLNFNTIFDKAFTYLPSVTHNIEDLKIIVRHVLQNFISDNVIYIELRSSPKRLGGLGYKDYFRCIIEEFKAHSSLITARFIVSISRTLPPCQYEGIIDQIKSVDPDMKYIVGLDFSGDARMNNFKDYLHIMKEAREAGYKITLHTPELETGIAELNTIIDFKPERLGHFIFYEEYQLQKVKELEIPIEICPTSNYVVRNLNSHHFIDLVNSGIKKMTICTDDILLFKASLSEEWLLFMDKTKLDINQIFDIYYESIEYVFDDSVKPILKKAALDFKEKYLTN